MASLKEIKARIASVQNTLKITSAMKLVASSKLRRAQAAIEGMRPYERQMHHVLAQLLAQCAPAEEAAPADATVAAAGPAALVVLSSNSSLCGGFNAAVIARARAFVRACPDTTVYAVGRKGADALRAAGYPSPADFSRLSDHPSYAAAAALAADLETAFREGRYSRIVLLHNHFVSTSRQEVVQEVFLPQAPSRPAAEAPGVPAIVEPSAPEMLAELQPKYLALQLYTALLDSAAAEHAARTVAMQTATDNAQNLLQELSLLYNKSRQQKITAEILDLAGGAQPSF